MRHSFGIPPSGVYHLLVQMEKPRRILVGALGSVSFSAGYYTYTGRAMRGLPARLARHARRSKRLRWHIDYLLLHSRLVEVRVVPTNDPEEEEKLAQALGRQAKKTVGDAAHAVFGFGSSDSFLPSHLFFWGIFAPKIHGRIWGRPACCELLRIGAN
jgi:sugar fermentation stimulation protein A